MSSHIYIPTSVTFGGPSRQLHSPKRLLQLQQHPKSPSLDPMGWDLLCEHGFPPEKSSFHDIGERILFQLGQVHLSLKIAYIAVLVIKFTSGSRLTSSSLSP